MAEGEFQAADRLSQSAGVISREPDALTLRSLQTLACGRLLTGASEDGGYVRPPVDRRWAGMPAVTIAQALERDRLEHRARRMELVIGALRDRARHHQAHSGGAPPPLLEAIVGFERELNALRHRLEEIADGTNASAAEYTHNATAGAAR